MHADASTRIWVILARDSDVAVVLRRGPSKQVLLIRWHRRTDTFYPGQWFKGSLYPLRCDLSPSGERFLYFAADFQQPYYSWTAVSRPPYLTALALWPKGDCWGGGGQFAREDRIVLNHRPAEMALADPFRLPSSVTVVPFGARSGWGEDSPLHDSTLERDAWVLADPGKATSHKRKAPIGYSFDPPRTWSKPNPCFGTLSLRFMLTGYFRRGGPKRVTEAALVTGGESTGLGEVDWADWDTHGDLLFARDGCVYRQRVEPNRLGDAVCILDARTHRFRSLEPRAEALTWDDPLDLSDRSSVEA
ncbi:conserved hypothetical protein [uncultured Defluviicoccus sp.]|uniref:Uncharacterized protein n=1 Tax=metagenome TaxID=256318 RepID=A0A380TDW8_9ZZZZ|nr:conserved hypothetical protein [uncultured Defluviicoccus sp.]